MEFGEFEIGCIMEGAIHPNAAASTPLGDQVTSRNLGFHWS
jgi:hypothetical protein